jgi:ribosomal protein L7/L12
MNQSESGRIIELSMRVAELERKVEFLLGHLHLEYRDQGYDPTMAEITELLRRGNKIEAIKIYRERHNVGLAEAKAAIDRIEANLTGKWS